MIPLFLTIILSVLVIYSITFMLRRGHDVHALAFFTLFLYTVFTQIGYVYFPELSILIGAYYGEALFYEYWAFMFFSFLFTFLLYIFFNPVIIKKEAYIVKPTSLDYGQYLFFTIAIVLYLILNLYFLTYRASFNYGGGRTMGGPWFGIGFWIYTICTLILFTLFRDKSNKNSKRIFSFVLFFLFLIFFLQVTFASGIRSAIFYFFLSIAFFELSPILKKGAKFQKRKILIFTLAAFLVISMLSTLRGLRIQGGEIGFSSFSDADLTREEEMLYADGATGILFQDYYHPSHTLFISMYYDIIIPIEVIKSNIANSLVLLKYPYLTTTIVARESGEIEGRGFGWGYHYFVEGYNAMGFLGVFYNALFWNLGMLLWMKLTQSNNRMHNRVMLSFTVLIIIITMRGQFADFLKFYWLILLTGLALLLLANNSTIAFLRQRGFIDKNE